MIEGIAEGLVPYLADSYIWAGYHLLHEHISSIANMPYHTKLPSDLNEVDVIIAGGSITPLPFYHLREACF
jgi:hypothetical protein